MRGAALAFAVLVAAGAQAEPRPAAGGVHLFRALERAPLALVGQVSAPRRLDEQAYTAEVRAQNVLRGPAEKGAPIAIAWEELSPSRRVRFAQGDSVLLAIERLPGASIWRQRIPDPEQLARTRGIAERGDAFLRNPSPGEVELVEHFLALPPELRDGNPGVAHLVALAEGAQPTLALAALERLAEVAELDPALDEVTAGRLVATLLRDPPEVAAAALALVEHQAPESLRAPLVFRAPDDGMGPAPVYRALASLDGRLDPALAAALWRREDSGAHRAVAAAWAPPEGVDTLVRRLRRDPSPEVRAAAATRLAELEGADQIDRLLFALEDPEPIVRRAALQAVASLGGAAVPGLRRVADTGTPEAAQAAVGALRVCGPDGVRVLRELAAGHPDESVRTLARAALGGEIGHTH